MSSLPPGTVLLLGALVLPLLRGRWLKIVSIALPIASFAHLLFSFPTGHHVAAKLFDYSLIPVRVDQLSLVWGYVFHLAAILAAIYGMHVRSRVHHCCAAAYVGSAIGAVFAGDLLTLFLFWEITAVASVFLVWEGTQREAVGAGLRYALFHIASGVLILAGAVMVVIESGSLEFGAINAVGVFHEMKGWGPSLLFLGIGIKAAFPLVHTWLPDAYSNATPAGAVFLSAFTTKMAVYALARGFAGSESLVVIGAMMCVFPLLHALLADDLRRTLAHVFKQPTRVHGGRCGDRHPAGNQRRGCHGFCARNLQRLIVHGHGRGADANRLDKAVSIGWPRQDHAVDVRLLPDCRVVRVSFELWVRDEIVGVERRSQCPP